MESGGWVAASIIDRAAHLSASEVVALGRAADAQFQTPYKPWVTAMAAASDAAGPAGRTGELAGFIGRVNDAVFQSLVLLTNDRGRDGMMIQERYEVWKRACEAEDERAQRSRFRQLRRGLLRVSGLRVQHGMLGSIMGTEGAVAAACTWDLVAPDGPYVVEQRDLLFSPWASSIEGESGDG